MNKIINLLAITSFLALNTANVSYSYESLPVNPGVFDAGSINSRNMQMLREQEFNREEYRNFKSIKEIQEEHNKELESTTLEDNTLYQKINERKFNTNLQNLFKTAEKLKLNLPNSSFNCLFRLCNRTSRRLSVISC